MIIAFHKPYLVLSQFKKEKPEHHTLAEFGFPQNIYSIGRLDLDSEGLLLLSDEKKWNDLLLNPKHAHERTYHVQVEGTATENAINKLRKGVVIQGYKTKPCTVILLNEPNYAPRSVPIRFRKSIPTSWIEIKLVEGKNRQVRQMTASVELPTLRLIRVAIGKYELGNLLPGKWKELNSNERKLLIV